MCTEMSKKPKSATQQKLNSSNVDRLIKSNIILFETEHI